VFFEAVQKPLHHLYRPQPGDFSWQKQQPLASYSVPYYASDPLQFAVVLPSLLPCGALPLVFQAIELLLLLPFSPASQDSARSS